MIYKNKKINKKEVTEWADELLENTFVLYSKLENLSLEGVPPRELIIEVIKFSFKVSLFEFVVNNIYSH